MSIEAIEEAVVQLRRAIESWEDKPVMRWTQYRHRAAWLSQEQAEGVAGFIHVSDGRAKAVPHPQAAERDPGDGADGWTVEVDGHWLEAWV